MSPFDGIPDDYDLAQLKTPPHSVEAEQSVIGGLLIGAEFDAIAEQVAVADFYRPEHRAIFGRIAALADAGQPVDLVTVADALAAAGELDRAGGFVALAEIAKDTPSAANIRAYAAAVRERAALRNLIRVGQQVAESAYEPDGQTAAQLVDQAQALLSSIDRTSATAMVSTADALRELLAEIDRRGSSDSLVTGLATGFKDLDERTRGLQPGDLIVVAGRPSMGKTTFAMNLAEHVAVEQQKAVLVFSMEMSRAQLLERSLSSLARIPLREIQTGRVSGWDRLTTAAQRLHSAPLTIDDRPALSVAQMRSAARRARPALMVVDYLQLARAGTARSDGRTEEVSAISRGLKSIAKELGIPVIALSQLNRELERRPVNDRRPRNSDLRDSGAIEQDADVILALYRDEVYRGADSDQRGIAEVITTKFRNGVCGTDYLAANLHTSRFDALAFEHRPTAQSEPAQRRRAGFEY